MLRSRDGDFLLSLAAGDMSTLTNVPPFSEFNNVSLFISHSSWDGVTGPALGCPAAASEIPDFSLGEE